MARDYVSVACEHQALVDIRAQLSRALLQWRIASMSAMLFATLATSQTGQTTSLRDGTAMTALTAIPHELLAQGFQRGYLVAGAAAALAIVLSRLLSPPDNTPA